MKTYHWLFLFACAAVAVPFILSISGLDNYGANEGMIVEDWMKLWSWPLTFLLHSAGSMPTWIFFACGA